MSHETPETRDGFLSRWSQRKQAAAAEKTEAPAEVTVQNPSTGALSGTKMAETPHPEQSFAIESPTSPTPHAPLPTVESLTTESDFSPFMAKDVDPGIRNEAMKKLFTDTHYHFDNMDKLDIYIDDYSKPDPIPLEMLKMMNQSRALGLFDTTEEDESAQTQKVAEIVVEPVDATETAPPATAPADLAPPVESAEPLVVDSTDSKKHPA